MHDAALVRVPDRLGDLTDDLGGSTRRQWTAGDRLREAPALDQAHREERFALMLAELEHRDDAGVVEPGGDLRLLVEASDLGLVGEGPGQDDLQGNGPIQADLSRRKTIPMPPRAISPSSS